MHCALSFSFFFFSCLLFHVHETSVPEPTVGSVAGSISGSGTGGSMDGTGGMAGYCLVLLSIYNVYHQGHAKTFPGCGKSYKIKKKWLPWSADADTDTAFVSARAPPGLAPTGYYCPVMTSAEPVYYARFFVLVSPGDQLG